MITHLIVDPVEFCLEYKKHLLLWNKIFEPDNMEWINFNYTDNLISTETYYYDRTKEKAIKGVQDALATMPEDTHFFTCDKEILYKVDDEVYGRAYINGIFLRRFNSLEEKLIHGIIK